MSGLSTPDEATALLGEHRRSHTPSRPPITPTVERIRAQGAQVIARDSTLIPPLPSTVEETAFRLIVLLQSYILTKRATNARKDVWEAWSQELVGADDGQELERHVLLTWSDFIEVERSSLEIEECLWCEFPLVDGQGHVVRVVDFLKQSDAPEAFLSHRLVLLSLEHTWRYGKILQPAPSFWRRAVQRFDAKPTPRVIHAFDTLLQLGYLVLLAHYILNPPERPIIAMAPRVIGAREILLLLYSFGALCRPSTPQVIPSTLVILAFLFSLPAAPFPGDTSYTIVLFSLVLHILLLHLPRPPSPNFFLPVHITLPLSTLLWYEFTRTLFPVLLFYLPAFIVSSYLLSMSIIESFPHFPPTLLLSYTAPMQTRQGLLILWGIVQFLVLASTALLVLFSASLLSLPHRPTNPWDRYSQPVGYQARRIFVSAVTMYSAPLLFPPPLNLPRIVLISLPRIVFRISGKKEPAFIRTVERILWRVTVGLPCLVVAGLWLWR